MRPLRSLQAGDGNENLFQENLFGTGFALGVLARHLLGKTFLLILDIMKEKGFRSID